MPTECERSVAEQQQDSILTQTQQFIQQEQKDFCSDIMDGKESFNGEMSTSQTSTTSSNGHNGNTNGLGKKVAITSPDPTAYVAKARVTRPTPPPPSYNPMQFVQIKPCNLYQTAQQQLKKAEEVKKIKEIKKEEPEDWQNNLDNWKSSRRKRVEHIIDRVVEVKKLELEEHDRTRRKSKTFSEMIEERGDRPGRTRAKLTSLAVYNEDESNDFSDLGIGTSSASGKSSLSEDYDNNSVLSDNVELDKAIFENNHKLNSTTREYISSPGYDTSSSTAPASSPDPCEYTYEGAIQDYKQRVSRAISGTGVNYKLNSNNITQATSSASKESTPERTNNGLQEIYPTRRGSKIEDRLIGFEVTSPSDSQEGVEKQKVDLPKIDISKRKEIFENQQNTNTEPKLLTNAVGVPKVTLRDRFKIQFNESVNNDIQVPVKNEVKRLSGDITSIRDRLQSLEQQQNIVNSTNGATKNSASKLVDIPVPPLKERLSSLQNAVTKEELKKPPVALVDARQLEIMKNEEETAKQRMKQLDSSNCLTTITDAISTKIVECPIISIQSDVEVDRDDSGIHTSDDIDGEERIADQLKREQEQQLNAAIAALALEEKQLEEAANAVNQIEAEFAELTSNPSPLPSLGSVTNEQPCEMEFSVSSTNNLLNNTSNKNRSNSSESSKMFGKEEAKCISNDNVVKTDEVLVNLNVPNIASNLRRKPSNEMVHARNLLKMFKETFQNDIELDEDDENVTNVTNIEIKPKVLYQTRDITPINNLPHSVVETQNSPLSINTKMLASQQGPVSPLSFINQTPTSPKSPLNSPISTQIFQTSRVTPQTPPSPTLPIKSPGTPTMIPRSINPTGKPPMSPKSARRHVAKLPPQSPLQSPTPTRKSESQFSINGRVEIFNSKNMSNIPKPPTPTMTTKKTHLSYLPTPTATAVATPHGKQDSANDNNNIKLLAEQEQQRTPSTTTSSRFTEPLSVSNTKSMPVSTVNEPHEIRSPNAAAAAVYVATATVVKQQTTIPKQQQPQRHQQHQQQQQTQPEVVICAPPVTIINPDELPKPNTVKALSNCFLREDEQNKKKPPALAPKPLPRSRIPQTPPQSPTPSKRNFTSNAMMQEEKLTTAATTAQLTPLEIEDDATRKLSIVSEISINSRDSLGQPGGHANIENIDTKKNQLKLSTQRSNQEDPLKPNDILSPKVVTPSEVPPLVICVPNESSLFKLASSAPTSPVSPTTPVSAHSTKINNKPCDDDIAFCSSFLSSLTPSKSTKSKNQMEPLQRQQTMEEVVCKKVDVHKLPPDTNVICTSYCEVDNEQLKRCDGAAIQNTELNELPPIPTKSKPKVIPNPCDEAIAFCSSFLSSLTPSNTQKTKPTDPLQRQQTMEDVVCEKVDVNKLPPHSNLPCTSYTEVDNEEIKRCDGISNQYAAPKNSTPTQSTTKLNSPIMAARAAHSKALIETCEKIIAEEREASNQMKSSLATTPKSTPILQRKSKIPKPIPCCTGSDSMNNGDYEPVPQVSNENNSEIADATTTKPKDDEVLIARLHVVETQIKVTTTTPPASPKVNLKTHPNNSKKTKNIFDFLKRNFGHHEEETNTTAVASGDQNDDVNVVKFDEIRKVENSKFYVPTEDTVDAPPPLPTTAAPAPVNIEITKKITTDEIVEESNSENTFSQEINDLLDDELNKLSLEGDSVVNSEIIKK